MRATRAAVVLALVLIAGCDSGGGSPGRSGSPLLHDDGDLLVRCGTDLAFPPRRMDAGLDVSSLDPARIDAALHEVFHSFGIPPADQTWKALVAEPADDPTMLVLAVGPWTATGPVGETAVSAGLQREGDGWRAMRWGNCSLEPALPNGSTWARLTLPARVEPRSTSINLRVSEWECTSGRNPSPYLHQPYVDATNDAVTVYWTTAAASGDVTCPGNPAVIRTIELASPLGSRTLFDGAVWPPRALWRAAR